MIYHSIQIQFNVSQQASAPQDSNGLRTSPCISMRLVSTRGKHWELEMFCRLSCCNSSHARAILTCIPQKLGINTTKITNRILGCEPPTRSQLPDWSNSSPSSRDDWSDLGCWLTQSALQRSTALELSSAFTALAKKPLHQGKDWTKRLASCNCWQCTVVLIML